MCALSWHVPHCSQLLVTKGHCIRPWGHKAAWPPAFSCQHLLAFSPAATCTWSGTVQRQDALPHVPGLGSFSPSALASCPVSTSSCTGSSQTSHFCCCPVFHAASHFKPDQMRAEVGEEFPLALDSLFW